MHTDPRMMKSVNLGNALQACSALLLVATMSGITHAQATPDRITLLAPAVLSMQTPIGEAHMELPVGTVIENGALVNGGIQIEKGGFTGWIPLECAKLPASKAKAEEAQPSPSPTPTPSPTAVPILDPIKPYEQPENSLLAFCVLLGVAILLVLYKTTFTQKWFRRHFRKWFSR